MAPAKGYRIDRAHVVRKRNFAKIVEFESGDRVDLRPGDRIVIEYRDARDRRGRDDQTYVFRVV